eukprot:2329721-Prorocentrum_lima.AAC.1
MPSISAYHVAVRDRHLEDITRQWRIYRRLMKEVTRHNLQSEVPPPILININDSADPPILTLKISAQNFMDISAEIADTLRKHKILTATVITGEPSHARVCLGPEPVTKALPADRPPCAHAP